MFKLFVELFILPFRIMGWFLKVMFWIPLILIGLIFDDGGPGPGVW